MAGPKGNDVVTYDLSSFMGDDLSWIIRMAAGNAGDTSSWLGLPAFEVEVSKEPTATPPPPPTRWYSRP
jgi:hypothetical protein